MKLEYPIQVDDNGNAVPFVIVKILLIIRFGPDKTLPECNKEVLEDLGLKIFTSFNPINVLGNLRPEGNYSSDLIAEYSMTAFGRSLEETATAIQKNFVKRI